MIESKNVPKEFLKKFLPRELGNHCPLPAHKNVVSILSTLVSELSIFPTEKRIKLLTKCKDPHGTGDKIVPVRSENSIWGKRKHKKLVTSLLPFKMFSKSIILSDMKTQSVFVSDLYKSQYKLINCFSSP